MKNVRFGIAAAVVAASVLMTLTSANSGTYHYGSQLVCSDCHSMHYSENSGAPARGISGPNDKLLLQTNVCNLCLSCHDGALGTNAAPDVMTIAGVDHATLRAAGAFRAIVGATSVQSHDICVPGAVTAPGGTWATAAATGLTCSDCHDEHGTANYRNLQTNPGGIAGAVTVTVTEAVITPTATQYGVGNLRYTNVAADGMSRWCAGCHKNFFFVTYGTFPDANIGGSAAGDTTAAGDQWKRHPASHVTFTEGSTNAHVDSTFWTTTALSRTPYIDVNNSGTADAGDNVFCGSCHKAHGSDVNRTTATAYPSNLIYDDFTTAGAQNGTSLLNLCQGCHNQ